MESRLGFMICLATLGCAGFLAHSAQSRLDAGAGKERFREFMYLPSGRALKISAFGFDAPLADSLYIKTLIYYSDNMRARMKKERSAQHKYLFQAFDVITNLNPRYYHAYYYGGLLLSAAGKPDLAIKILEKGLGQYPQDWQLHMHLATTADMQLKDRALALKHYGQAIRCPGVPSTIIDAWAGMQAEGMLDAPVEKRLDFQIAVWRDALKDPNHRREFRDHAERMLARMETARLMIKLTDAARRFIEIRKRPPASLEELAGSEFFSAPVYQFIPGDRLVMAPDGEIVSMALAEDALNASLAEFDKAIAQYKKKKKHPPFSLWQLYIEDHTKQKPIHPLAKFGYRLEYDMVQDRAVEIKPNKGK